MWGEVGVMAYVWRLLRQFGESVLPPFGSRDWAQVIRLAVLEIISGLRKEPTIPTAVSAQGRLYSWPIRCAQKDEHTETGSAFGVSSNSGSDCAFSSRAGWLPPPSLDVIGIKGIGVQEMKRSERKKAKEVTALGHQIPWIQQTLDLSVNKGGIKIFA